MDYKQLENDLKNIFILNQRIIKPYENVVLRKLPAMPFRTLCVLNIEGELSLNELASIQKITKQQQSIIIKGLDSEGYIERKINLNDRRSTYFTITTKGRELLDGQLSLMMEAVVTKIKGLDKNKQIILHDAIHSICEVLDEIGC